jgi:signal peptidase I
MLAAALVLYVLLRTFVVEAYRIPSASMERTLLAGDFLLVNKLRYGARLPFSERRLPGWRAPAHNDVIVFTWPVDPDKHFVKRVVGLPGDTLVMRGGVLERNGTRVAEPWVYRTASPDERGRDSLGDTVRDSWGPIVVPPRQFFVLGDHRDDSLDSRYWGFVPEPRLIGAPWRLYFSIVPDSTSAIPRSGFRWGSLPSQVRWARIGRAVE